MLFITLESCEQKAITLNKALLSNVGSSAHFQAISILDENKAWVSGHTATFARTLNGGISWQVFKHESDTLQFRDIHAFDESKVVLMSAGKGKSSRIFLFDATTETFTETYIMTHPEGFLNTIEFWDNKHGLAFGDSFNGNLFAMKTIDGGQSWERINPELLPPAGVGEGGFAASGTCISVRPEGKAWIATGAGGNSRILYTADFGNTWESFDNPIIKGAAAGPTSINMINDQLGIIAGGDLAITDKYTDNIAITKDGGLSWQLTNAPITKGAFYGSTILSKEDKNVILVSGPKGIDYSFDLGQTWQNLDTTNYWAVKLHTEGYGYATGPKGNILKLEIK